LRGKRLYLSTTLTGKVVILSFKIPHLRKDTTISPHPEYMYIGLQSFPHAQTTLFKSVSVLTFPFLDKESSLSPQIYG